MALNGLKCLFRIILNKILGSGRETICTPRTPPNGQILREIPRKGLTLKHHAWIVKYNVLTINAKVRFVHTVETKLPAPRNRAARQAPHPSC